jgi:1-acyl-sn-glycerol-3-phosphate acyltransferase
MISSWFYLFKIKIMSKNDPKKAEDYAYERAKKMSDYFLKLSNTIVHLEGAENIPEGPCVFVSNHQGIFDGFLVYSNANKKQLSIIVKREVKKLPTISRWMSEINSIFIDRFNMRESVKAIYEGVEKLKEGYSVIIFPEGTRSKGPFMNEFKKGSLKLAINANVPVIPITIQGSYNILEVGHKVLGNKVEVFIHKPIYMENLTKEQKSNLSLFLHDVIEVKLKELVSKNPETV